MIQYSIAHADGSYQLKLCYFFRSFFNDPAGCEADRQKEGPRFRE